jgi:putative flavoprotein involved in K+ transport
LRLDIDRWITAHGLEARSGPPEPFRPSPLPSSPSRLSLANEGIRTVVWATGFRRSYPWLRVPALDDRGELMHRGGVTRVPGLFALGLNLMRRRSSTFLHGVGQDAEELADAFFTEPVRRGVRRGAA